MSRDAIAIQRDCLRALKLLACACALCLCALAASPLVAHAAYEDIADNYGGISEVTPVADAITASEIPDGTYTDLTVQCSTTYLHPKFQYLTVQNGQMALCLKISSSYTDLYMGTAEEAAAAAASKKGYLEPTDIEENTFVFPISALNSKFTIAAYTYHWFTYSLVIDADSSSSVAKAIQEAIDNTDDKESGKSDADSSDKGEDEDEDEDAAGAADADGGDGSAAADPDGDDGSADANEDEDDDTKTVVGSASGSGGNGDGDENANDDIQGTGKTVDHLDGNVQAAALKGAKTISSKVFQLDMFAPEDEEDGSIDYAPYVVLGVCLLLLIVGIILKALHYRRVTRGSLAATGKETAQA